MKKPLVIAAICGIAIVVGVVVYLSNEKKKKADEKEQQPEVKEPEEQDTINYQVERPFQIKKNLVQMKLCCSKALFSKTKMKCNCH